MGLFGNKHATNYAIHTWPACNSHSTKFCVGYGSFCDNISSDIIRVRRIFYYIGYHDPFGDSLGGYVDIDVGSVHHSDSLVTSVLPVKLIFVGFCHESKLFLAGDFLFPLSTVTNGPLKASAGRLPSRHAMPLSHGPLRLTQHISIDWKISKAEVPRCSFFGSL